MPEPEEILGGVPDVVRNSNRPIIIYQGPPPGALETSTSNALALLSWLALLSVCLAGILFCVWQVWNPGYDKRQFSPIYAQGRPLGLAKQIEEREQINARALGLASYRDQLWATSHGRVRPEVAAPPLIGERDGVDDVRRQWDVMCNIIRTRLYDRRLAMIDARAAELRRQRALANTADERTRINGGLDDLQLQRAVLIENQRTDGDPALRCVPAAEAPACSASDPALWCNPSVARPNEFVEEAGYPR